jgi:small-conductance mechanosensitive channel
LGVGGLAVALGLQDTLTNVFAGLNILASKKMKLGDEIELPSKKQGIITDITWRHTILKTDASTIIVPNSYVVKEVIENFGKPEKDKAKKKK